MKGCSLVHLQKNNFGDFRDLVIEKKLISVYLSIYWQGITIVTHWTLKTTNPWIAWTLSRYLLVHCYELSLIDSQGINPAVLVTKI